VGLVHLFEPDFSDLKKLERRAYVEVVKDMTLRCKACRYYFRVKPRVVFILKEAVDFPEKVVCPRCQREEEFEIPEDEELGLRAQALSFLETPESELYEDGVFPTKDFIVNIKGVRTPLRPIARSRSITGGG